MRGLIRVATCDSVSGRQELPSRSATSGGFRTYAYVAGKGKVGEGFRSPAPTRVIGSPRDRRPKASLGGNRVPEGSRSPQARYGDLNAAVSAGWCVERAPAPGSGALAGRAAADWLSWVRIFREAARRERLREVVSGAATQRQDEAGGGSERTCEAGSGAMLVMRCRS
jgi:hypothetical protein